MRGGSWGTNRATPSTRDGALLVPQHPPSRLPAPSCLPCWCHAGAPWHLSGGALWLCSSWSATLGAPPRAGCAPPCQLLRALGRVGCRRKPQPPGAAFTMKPRPSVAPTMPVRLGYDLSLRQRRHTRHHLHSVLLGRYLVTAAGGRLAQRGRLATIIGERGPLGLVRQSLRSPPG